MYIDGQKRKYKQKLEINISEKQQNGNNKYC